MGLTQVNTSSHLGQSYHVGRNIYFKLSQLSQYVYCCCGISVHESGWDIDILETKAISYYLIITKHAANISNNFPIVKLAKSTDCGFSCVKFDFQKASIDCK